MSNPFPSQNPDFNPDGAFFLPRIRSSYASALGTSGPSAAHLPFNHLSHLLNHPQQSSSDLHSTGPFSASRASESVHTNMPANGHWSHAARTRDRARSQLPRVSRQYEYVGYHGDGLVTPSYLRNTAYMQKLEEAREAQHAQTELLQPPSEPSSNSFPKSTIAHHGMKIDVVERAPPLDEDVTVQPLPSRCNKDDKYGPIEISGDGLDIRHSVPRVPRNNDYDHEFCSIRSDHPMPSSSGLYYFEVSILTRKRDDTSICIGLCAKNTSLSRPPGWEPDSWGYHGDDGELYMQNNVGKSYAEPFGPNDVIGCGVNFRTRKAFFTKNGIHLGTAFENVKDDLYPCVGLKKSGEHVRVNFGQRPFQFDIDGMMKEQQRIVQQEIAQTSIELGTSTGTSETDLIQQLVLQFLQHDGYVETARAFGQEIVAEKKALNLDPSAPVVDINIKDDEDAHRRQRIRRAVLEGDIDQALKQTSTYYPQVLKDYPQVYFRLRCRKFIEMARKCADAGASTTPRNKKANGHALGEDPDDGPSEMDLDEDMEDGASLAPAQEDLFAEAIQYGQLLQAEFQGSSDRQVTKSLSEVFALLAYPDPLQVKEVAPLLDRKGRVSVAEELNSAILSSLGKSSRSAIETVYSQTSVLLDELRHGGPGSFVTLQSITDAIPKTLPL